jgi:predicted amidophosphoribosyltransferase
MFCDRCGAALQQDQRFCGRCGKEFSGTIDISHPRPSVASAVGAI